MKTLALAFAIVVFCASIAQADDSQIVGTWAADARTKGGLGATMVFSEAGAVTYTFGALVDFRYEIDGESIRTIYGKDTTGNSDHTEAYKIHADILTIDGTNPDPAKRLEMKRIGLAPPGARPVVGVWQFMHYTGVPATWQYTSDGLAQLSIPFQTSRGRYTLSRSMLSLAMDEERPAELRIDLRGDHLTLFKPERPQHFTRVVP